jgi:hypothetical protein
MMKSRSVKLSDLRQNQVCVGSHTRFVSCTCARLATLRRVGTTRFIDFSFLFALHRTVARGVALQRRAGRKRRMAGDQSPSPVFVKHRTILLTHKSIQVKSMQSHRPRCSECACTSDPHIKSILISEVPRHRTQSAPLTNRAQCSCCCSFCEVSV